MTAPWTASQAEFPKSVHALMALWGGFSEPQQAVDGCLEKRLELDLRRPIDPASVDPQTLVDAMQPTGDGLLHHRVNSSGRVLTFHHSIMLLTERRVLVVSDSSVLLHAALRPLINLVQQWEVDVEWASFMRMNLASPWSPKCEISDIMAQEYAELKSVFPSGHPYLTGPVDRDHFFYFVYDNIERKIPNARREEDVQINIYMHNINVPCQDGNISYESLKNIQEVEPLPCATEYEVLRISGEENGTSFVSFETNAADAEPSNKRVLENIERFAPDRFSMVVLQDRDGHLANRRHVFGEVRGYSILSRAVNHFGEGYAFHQAVYVRNA
ncbi:S-adenosylmethionine decarboxylase proenzyme [Trypanosoma theileri]|uniref:S-adenosylmethionine decarboxylase proenzyme n=1 Tax=Trypanosoma theileri TaxID=67003 RepID=A0A1X0P1C0_9TRYP|nr:S-adenosylmethionine decarboxylase proenzyme [Trypanosoma theileri]ORC90746.1 S-adenosylmethionine decarboxylase proenzyme [Trypanosoma theileri]